ncbi:hypothetical protein MRB53_039349 [Persea americana]|nr:hypothetical protein MRB53_039349 [Persea americana]
MSARDISAGQLQAYQTYNLNAQAMEATIQLIQEVLDSGVNVREIYIDTIGPPITYQKKLERIFPAQRITVAKKLIACILAYLLLQSAQKLLEMLLGSVIRSTSRY